MGHSPCYDTAVDVQWIRSILLSPASLERDAVWLPNDGQLLAYRALYRFKAAPNGSTPSSLFFSFVQRINKGDSWLVNSTSILGLTTIALSLWVIKK